MVIKTVLCVFIIFHHFVTKTAGSLTDCSLSIKIAFTVSLYIVVNIQLKYMVIID